jgi:hypothetical protein
MDLTPIDVATSTTFTGIGVNLNVIGAISSGTVLNLRLGIYNDDGTYSRPSGAPLLDAGTLNMLATTGDKFITISQLLAPGRYWLAVTLQSDGVCSTAPTLTTASTMLELIVPTTLGTNGIGKKWQQSGATGALPTIASPGRNTGAPIVVGLKV